MLPMTQEDGDLDSLVRKRLRALRVAQGWSLEELASRAHLSQSSLSRIENGQRRLAWTSSSPSPARWTPPSTSSWRPPPTTSSPARRSTAPTPDALDIKADPDERVRQRLTNSP